MIGESNNTRRERMRWKKGKGGRKTKKATVIIRTEEQWRLNFILGDSNLTSPQFAQLLVLSKSK